MRTFIKVPGRLLCIVCLLPSLLLCLPACLIPGTSVTYHYSANDIYDTTVYACFNPVGLVTGTSFSVVSTVCCEFLLVVFCTYFRFGFGVGKLIFVKDSAVRRREQNLEK
mmetsp:Transcript_36922/g.58054  ORF Transcript_36922/g.58054 Transcript_36922/m.58054 type:complete len:110 (-) Transcript_36922:270-599(-)